MVLGLVQVAPDEGVIKRNGQLRIGYVPQKLYLRYHASVDGKPFYVYVPHAKRGYYSPRAKRVQAGYLIDAPMQKILRRRVSQRAYRWRVLCLTGRKAAGTLMSRRKA